ncbi:MAG: aminotransferase class I/II-fold pyridoxal phosphate-dependent enzyme [Rhizobiaceae bacterium]
MPDRFEKSFTQQEPISDAAIERAAEILRSGRLHRYNVAAGEESEASALEREYAAWQGANYCLATTSGGQALQIALRAAGVEPGDMVLANAYTLAPVPGAIFAVGAVPVLVEIDDSWHTDPDDLETKARESGARFLLLSHMRGHIADMERIATICTASGITMIEDCAHTMGAHWKGTLSGNFGSIACFSTQTYKHMNSGEGGLLTTNDAEIAARAVIASGSYMNYAVHGAIPPQEVFQAVRLNVPNCSARLDNLRAALIRDQLPRLNDNIARWNIRYRIIEESLRKAKAVRTVERAQHEAFVGSSIQFHADGIAQEKIPHFVRACGERGVEIKWFGADEPVGFTSRFDSWHYLGDPPHLPQTRSALSTTCDMRIPLTFDEDDCRVIGEILADCSRAFA